MLDSYTTITDRAALYAATGDHPFARMRTQSDGVAYLGEAVTVWHGGTGNRRMVGALGDGPTALDVVVSLYSDATIGPGTRAELPRMDHALVHTAFPGVHIVDWDLRWLTSSPPVMPGEDDVVTLSERDHEEINAVLDAALPDAHNRPGSERIGQWYGIRVDGRLEAVAADSSWPGFGFLNSIAVRPDRHGGGLGSALTARIAREQLAEHGTVLLGVWADNVDASRLYHRLGFTGLHELTSFTLPDDRVPFGT